MSLIGFNCRGLGNTAAVNSLRNLIRREAPSLIFLSETKLSCGEMMKVKAKVSGYNGLAVDSCGRSGGVALLWREDIVVELRSMSIHHVDVWVRDGLGGKEWRFTGFYGWPEVQKRHLSWKLLEELAGQVDGPWICMGDFNEIMYSCEKKGGRDRAVWQMSQFREAVANCRLHDLPFSGYEFTYDNGQGGDDNVQCRLDRALVNDEWFGVFDMARGINLDREWSDHAPIKVVLSESGEDSQKKGERPFRFEQVWAEEGKCEEIIEGAWLVGGPTVPQKIGFCSEDLKAWSDKEFGQNFRELRKKGNN